MSAEALMGVNSAKSANSVICISYNKRLLGRAHEHIPHLVAEKVVGIWIFTVLAPVDIDLGAAVAIMTRVIIRSCFSIADHTVAITILFTRGGTYVINQN